MVRTVTATTMVLGMALTPLAQAQVLRGTVTSAAGGQPIEGAAVSLLDSSGARIGGSFSDATGGFVISAPGAGRYTVRAVRIGFHPLEGAPITLGAGQAIEEPLAMEPVPVALPTVVTEGDNRCVIRPDEGLAVATVWQAARAGLDAAARAEEQQMVRTTVVRFERTVRLDGKRTSERSWTLEGQNANPFQSAPPESLAVHGYSRSEDDSTVYFAPDANALLSDDFSDRHCFRLESTNDKDSTLVGLAFSPSKLGRKLDIEGVIWLDRATSELRYLDFHYTEEGPGKLDERLGGRIDFERLSNGATIVKRWVIRMPILSARIIRRTEEILLGAQRRLVAIREAGAEVAELRAASGGSLSRSSVASLTGTVHDSIQGVAAGGVAVFLGGTFHSTTTDINGRYRFDSLPPGHYTIAFDAPTLDSLGIAAPYASVELRAGTTTTADLAVPSVPVLLAALCPALPRGEEHALVTGVVRDAATARPLVNAEVVLTWQSLKIIGDTPRLVPDTLRVMADSLGAYRTCRAPTGETVQALARSGGHASGTIDVAIPRSGLAVRDLQVDMATPDGDAKAALLSGKVTSTDGAPVPGVSVALAGTARSVTTDTLGRFLLPNLPAGSQTAEFRRVGFAPLRRAVDLRRGDASHVKVRLVERAVTMDSVQVVGRAANADPTGFLERRERKRGGYFFDHREIVSRATQKLSDVLRMNPAVYVSSSGQVSVRRNVHNSLQTGCSLQYYVDGAPYVGTLDDFRAEDIEYMEVYPDGASIPGQFGGARGSCGVIVLWTRIARNASGEGKPR